MKDRIRFLWEKYSLHDAPLCGLDFVFEASEIRLKLELSDDIINELVPFTMIFGGVFKFESVCDSDGFFNPDECYGWNWKETESGRFEAVFSFFSEETGWELTLGFTSLETEGGPSEAALALRAAYFDEQTQG